MDGSVVTVEMIMSDNLVPTKYAGQDVRLLYSEDNPVNLGFWLANTYGHERVGLKDLVEYIGGRPYEAGHPENKEIAALIKAMPLAYHK